MPAAFAVLFTCVGLAAACEAAPDEELLANKACTADGTCEVVGSTLGDCLTVLCAGY